MKKKTLCSQFGYTVMLTYYAAVFCDVCYCDVRPTMLQGNFKNILFQEFKSLVLQKMGYFQPQPPPPRPPPIIQITAFINHSLEIDCMARNNCQ